MKFFDKFTSFKKAELAWDKKALEAKEIKPNKTISEKTKPTLEKFTLLLRIKILVYILRNDKDFILIKNFLKKPFHYFYNMIKSYFKKLPFIIDNGLYFYNLKSLNIFKKKLSSISSILVIGFSYCHKPLECPVGRFNDKCISDSDNTVCQQCFIGKCLNTTSDRNTIFLIIPDIQYIGEKIFEITQTNKGREILFIISACEMSLKMFSDLANMVNIKGLGINLSGRVCLNFKSFVLAEMGKKHTLTTISAKMQKTILDFLSLRKKPIS